MSDPSRSSALEDRSRVDGRKAHGYVLVSPLTGERLSERQILALAFSREPVQRERPIPENFGRELLQPTPGGEAWALLATPRGRLWFPVERLEV